MLQVWRRLHIKPALRKGFWWRSRCAGTTPPSRPQRSESSGTTRRYDWVPLWLQWMARPSSVLRCALCTPQCLAATPSQPLNLTIGFFRLIYRSSLHMLGEQSPIHRGSMTRRLPSLGLADLSKSLPGVWPLLHVNSYGEPQVRAEWQVGTKGWQAALEGHDSSQARGTTPPCTPHTRTDNLL